MDSFHKSLRVGIAAILCALVLRLHTSGFFRWAVQTVNRQEVAERLVYLQTGRRFGPVPSPSVPYPPESAEPVFAPQAPAETLPVFSPEDAETISVSYACSVRPDIGALLSAPLTLDLTGEEPTVLIVHTHTTESYTRDGEDYRESSAYRTLDENYNMLSIGAEVARVLEEGGIHVVQDRTLHDYPSYNGSYNHSRKSIREYLEAYPSIALVLDIHRDAADTGSGQLRTLAQVEGEDSAQLMLVMGTGTAGLRHENWQENLSLALKLQTVLERRVPGITRPTVLRGQRFNQDMSPGALLVEVGAAGNTHREALLAARALAEGILTLAGK